MLSGDPNTPSSAVFFYDIYLVLSKAFMNFDTWPISIGVVIIKISPGVSKTQSVTFVLYTCRKGASPWSH